jgi:hypothetical protein
VHSTTQFIIIIIIIMTPKRHVFDCLQRLLLCRMVNHFALSILSLSKGIPQDGLKDALANMYHSSTEYLGVLLFYTQLAAVLEIVHAGVGLVRSPVLP